MYKFTASGKAAAFALLLLGSTATIAAETAPRIGDFRSSMPKGISIR